MGRLYKFLVLVLLLSISSTFNSTAVAATDLDNGHDIWVLQTRIGEVDVLILKPLSLQNSQSEVHVRILAQDGTPLKSYSTHDLHFQVDATGIPPGKFNLEVSHEGTIRTKNVFF